MSLFVAMLKQVQGTWQTYTAALSILVMTFIIDGLGGFKFLQDAQAIQLAGFRVVRESISVVFGLLFSVFVVVAFYQSESLRRLSQVLTAANTTALNDLPELHLWLLSPLSFDPFLRCVFWLVFLSGYLWLAWFGLVHLLARGSWLPRHMGLRLFRAIGVFDLGLLAVCVVLGWRIFQNFEAVRTTLRALPQ